MSEIVRVLRAGRLTGSARVGLVVVVQYVMQGAAPLIVGVLGDHLGLGRAFVLAAALCVAVLVSLRRRLAHADPTPAGP